jgi:hypothetical protein
MKLQGIDLPCSETTPVSRLKERLVHQAFILVSGTNGEPFLYLLGREKRVGKLSWSTLDRESGMDRMEDRTPFKKITVPVSYDSHEHKPGGIAVRTVEEVNNLQDLGGTDPRRRPFPSMNLK